NNSVTARRFSSLWTWDQSGNGRTGFSSNVGSVNSRRSSSASSSPSGTGQVMPITAARRRYSPTVDRLTPVVMAICRSLTPRACRNLRTSRTFRIGALSAGIGPPLALAAKGASSAIRSPTSRASDRPHQGGRLRSEWVADFRRNRWPLCVGLRSRQAQTLQAYRTSMREDGAELRLVRRACSRLHLDQIRPHGLAYPTLGGLRRSIRWSVL